MKILIEGWEPTPAERALMDGTLDSFLAGADIQDVPKDLYKDKEEIMKESLQNFEEVYADFGTEIMNEDTSETTVSEEVFQQEWHRVVDEVYAEQYGKLSRVIQFLEQ